MLAIGSAQRLAGRSPVLQESWSDLARASWRLVGLWRERARQRKVLAELDARMLNDIGITRDAAERESSKPFWR